MTVVLLHPIGLDSGCWQFLDADLLADSRRPDLLWHGGRPRPPTPLSIAALADDVAAATGDGPLDVVGVSMGGAVAQQLALARPDRVRSLLLAASGAGGAGAAQLARAAAVDQDGIEGVLDSTLHRWFSAAALAEPGHPGVVYARETLLRGSAQSFAASWRALADHDTRERLPEIAAPTTVLHPAGDAAGSLDDKREMVERLPVARLEVVDGPHMVQLERPAELSAAVHAHLAWVAGLSSRPRPDAA